MNWQKGFEAGVAFTLRHLCKEGMSTDDISKFILELEYLRAWKTHDEWREFIEKNVARLEE